jgi:hypothetical protein
MTKKVYIFLIFIFGFVLTPNVSFACGTKSEKSCCKKENSKKAEIKDCCKKDNQNSKGKTSCDGSCGDKSCHCPPVFHFNFISASNQQSESRIIPTSDEKQKFSHIETYLSAGFYSIWTPPNIG